jgi:cyclic beta-1,2-glucan synthetase
LVAGAMDSFRLPDRSVGAAEPIRFPGQDEVSLYESATALAQSHARAGVRIARDKANWLRSELTGYFESLRRCHVVFLEVATQEKELAPAAEWLVDNFAKAEQHHQQVLQDLPEGYSRRLPRINSGVHHDRPRIYSVTWHYLASTDSRFSSETSISFIRKYQEITPLTIGELWAFAIHLRALLIENATRVSLRTLVSQQARDRGDAMLAKALEGSSGWNLEKELTGLPEHARHSLLVHLLRRLRERRGLDARHLLEVEKHILAIGFDLDTAVAEENARQAANNLTMQNIFRSFTSVAELDWEIWFGQVSLVDKSLSESVDYPQLDNISKTLYRNAIEDIARHSGSMELEVASKAVELGAGECGISLLGGKRRELEGLLGYRSPLFRRLRSLFGQKLLPVYLSTIAAFAVLFAVLAVAAADIMGSSVPTAVLLGILALFPAFEAAVALFNFVLTQTLRPAMLPGYSFKSGIPAEQRTMIAVPAMLTSFHGIEELLDRLEDHFLSNHDEQLHYALLTDWRDAESDSETADAALLSAAARGVDELNKRHSTSQFMLFHRKRQWNSKEGRWMGWERKRGKLAELNLFLRGNRKTSFIEFPQSVPQGIRYVIVLDADTQLPPGAARQLVGKMAHPLNRPVYDAKCARIVSGYGIIQPRITVSLPRTGSGSIYRRIFVHRPGLDPYVFAISDVYQDLFGEGSFAGKGIYDIDAMETALKERIPPNAVLSHDLLEGNYARAALATDVQVVEDFPDHYLVDMSRHHRWIRGDWQLLAWLRPFSPGITPLGWWKLFDNLRRSLLPPTLLLAFLAGWWFLPAMDAQAWTIYICTLVFIPIFLPIFAGSTVRKEEITTASELRTLGDHILTAVAAMSIGLALLVHRAWLSISAIATTLYRLLISRRHLLEWTAAAQVQREFEPGFAPILRRTWQSTLLGAAVLAVVAIGKIAFDAETTFAALPFALAWIAAPLLVLFINQPKLLDSPMKMSKRDVEKLRDVALATWRYFDVHVTAENNMLPPDNLQETPVSIVANRTSPTNIGLYILSTVSACDFGWIGMDEAVGRITATLQNSAKLERFRGHLLNWSDTTTLQPLEPRYVSSVDSGNFAAHLVTTANALEKWAVSSPLKAVRLEGLCDCARQVDQAVASMAQLHRKLLEETVYVRRQIAALIEATHELLSHMELVPLRILSLNVQINAIGQSCMRLMRDPEEPESANCAYWISKLRQSAEAMTREVTRDEAASTELKSRLLETARQCREMAYGMDFSFLVNRERKLLSIGYSVGEERLDEPCYDLLASEAALAYFFAIAKGDLDVELWQKLGRPVTSVHRSACLVSWSGSMFEYLMPHIVLNAPQQTLTHQSYALIVWKQENYGQQHGIPWGISESAFAARDVHQTYQYSNFGIPGLGLKRGLGGSLVIAPYATALAAMVNAGGAARNYAQIAAYGGRGNFGYYEAIDFTAERLPAGQKFEVVRAYFAHHQGMTITSVHNAISDGELRSYFHTENAVRAAELLLQERAPYHVPSRTVTVTEMPEVHRTHLEQQELGAQLLRPRDMQIPDTALYSNGRLHSVMAADGSNHLSWNGISINRWRDDHLDDPCGLRLMLRRAPMGPLHPIHFSRFAPPGDDDHHVRFHQDKAEFFWRNRQLECGIEYFIAPDCDAEVRRITLTNHGSSVALLELTGFMELALAPRAADLAHPAFSKLFVQTEFDEALRAVIATRRKRQASDPDIWTGHFLTTEGVPHSDETFETDRAAFLGRGRGFDHAQAFEPGVKLQGTMGYVLDPCLAFRIELPVQQRDSIRLYSWTVAAATREEVAALIKKHRSSNAYERIRTLAWTHALISLRHLSIAGDQAALIQKLTSRLIYSSPEFRPPPYAIASAMAPQAILWQFSISGIRPVIVVRIDSVNDLGVVQDILRAQEYWNSRGLHVDLVILNESKASYLQGLQAGLDDLAFRARTRRPAGHPANEQIFILRSALVPAQHIAGLLAMAHVVLWAAHGPLRTLRLSQHPKLRGSAKKKVPQTWAPSVTVQQPSGEGLLFFNGLGGFDAGDGEFVIHHKPRSPLPAPWINIIANEYFGTHCSAEGGGYTWFGNSKEQQITPWSNDPVKDPPGEMFLVRNVASGNVSSPTVQPLGPRNAVLTTRHGFGYSSYHAEEHGLRMELTVTVHPSRTVKLSRLVVRNTAAAPITLQVSFFAELAMGANGRASTHYVTSEYDNSSKALFLQNRYSPAFGDAVIFSGMIGGQDVATADRVSLFRMSANVVPQFGSAPVDMKPVTGGGLDPCIFLQRQWTIAAGESAECVVCLGKAADQEEARKLIAALQETGFAEILAKQKSACQDITSAFQVETPDKSFDLMMNGWLIYQTLVGRFYARSGFYQASGAYGFRDQLQDAMAVAYVRPDLARAHLLRAASRQFVEGDVQHWWLPETGAGTRSRISDDTVWLAYCTAHYVELTGDTAVLDEQVAFIEGEPVPEGVHDVFYVPRISERRASLYDHCVLALARSSKTGSRGLPFIGTGDWNDGMNEVGPEGRGESVWLGWFICATLQRFVTFADLRGDERSASTWRRRVSELAKALDQNGWDGNWYRRAYFDDGTPLGTAGAAECRIDSIAQSWAVLSGVADPDKAFKAMRSCEEQLIDRRHGLFRLFRPPLNEHKPNAGYIQSYPPGVRENGGQYTHGAIWAIFALARLGDGDRAYEMFSLINPVNHASDEEAALKYRVEPYVIAADVYGEAPYAGRGGWTWYTGASGWFYRAGLEAILGLRISGSIVSFKPTLPKHWPGFRLSMKCGGKRVVFNAARALEADVNGTVIAEGESIDLRTLDDGAEVFLLLDPLPEEA